MSDMLEKLKRAKEIFDGDQDNLCRAIMALSAAGHISIIPRDDRMLTKPVIMVPQQMYDRILKLSDEGEA